MLNRQAALCSLRFRTIALVSIVCTRLAVAENPPKSIDVHTFGATGDGKTLDTDAINRAITEAAAKPGGGVVQFTAGTYLSSSIHLQSNVTLQLDAHAIIEAADPESAAGYDAAEPNLSAGRYQDFAHAHWQNSLIWGDGLHDIAIVGPGEIRGDRLSDGGKHKIPPPNKAIGLKNCTGVTLRDFTVTHGGHFAILATGANELNISGLTIDTNRDGIDIDACQHVTINHCQVNAPNDDGICLKSSWALGRAVATEEVSITDCGLSGFDVGTLIDGTRQRKTPFPKGDGPVSRIKLGTESAGGFKNITISRCKFNDTRGLAIESVDGGVLENVAIDHLTMQNVIDSPIFIRLGSRLKRPRSPNAMSGLRHITLSDITATNVSPRFPVIIAGIDGHPIEDVTLTNVSLQFAGGGVKAIASTEKAMNDSRYPEPEIFGKLPAFGIYAAFVDGLTLSHVMLTVAKPDQRSAVVCEQVTGLKRVDVLTPEK